MEPPGEGGGGEGISVGCIVNCCAVLDVMCSGEGEAAYRELVSVEGTIEEVRKESVESGDEDGVGQRERRLRDVHSLLGVDYTPNDSHSEQSTICMS